MASNTNISLRHPTPKDHDALYFISVVTGDSGKDARPLLRDHSLIGAIYAVPYAVMEPQLCWVAEDAEGVLGFVVGTLDTRAFEHRLKTEWYPSIRLRTVDPGPNPRADATQDERELSLIHHPRPIPEPVVARYPAHMHMNLLPRARGRGVGRSLFSTWADAAREMGADGVHIGASKRNAGGIAFWAAMGFRAIDKPGDDGAAWMGQNLTKV